MLKENVRSSDTAVIWSHQLGMVDTNEPKLGHLCWLTRCPSWRNKYFFGTIIACSAEIAELSLRPQKLSFIIVTPHSKWHWSEASFVTISLHSPLKGRWGDWLFKINLVTEWKNYPYVLRDRGLVPAFEGCTSLPSPPWSRHCLFPLGNDIFTNLRSLKLSRRSSEWLCCFCGM